MTAAGIIFIFGVILLIIGLVMPENQANNIEDTADKTIDEINSFSESVFSELDEKYNELLFLYKMIDEKKNSMEKIDETTEEAEEKQTEKEIDDLGQIALSLKKKLSESVKVNYSNSKLEDIKKLHSEGLSVHEIAEKLEMGHREVELIMKLGRLI